MTEILTESFCERCGTRYTFQTPAPRKGGMKRLKVLSRGLKNYVLSDESTLEEAFADARSDEERSISSEQLDAFHQTFNFCMSCRQYTCGNCWNGPENLCLTCAPDLSREILPAAFPDMDPMAGIAPLELPQVGSAHANEDRAALAAASAWPDADLERDNGTEPSGAFARAVEIEHGREAAIAPEAPEVAETPEAIAALAAAAAPAESAGPAAPTTAEGASDEKAAAVAEPLVEAARPPLHPSEVPLQPRVAAPAPPSDERAAAAAAQTAALLARFRPDRDLDKALAEYEQAAEAAEPTVAAQPAMSHAEAAAAVPDAAAADAAAAKAAEAEPAPAPAAAAEPAAPEPQPAALEPAVPTAPVSPERRDDRVELPTWRIVAPDTTSTEPAASPPAITPATSPTTPAWPPLASADPTDGSGPQWPAAAFLAAPASRARDALWAASSAELVEKAGGGVQSCVSCGLPLSATARFCRRCGSRQG